MNGRAKSVQIFINSSIRWCFFAMLNACITDNTTSYNPWCSLGKLDCKLEIVSDSSSSIVAPMIVAGSFWTGGFMRVTDYYCVFRLKIWQQAAVSFIKQLIASLICSQLTSPPSFQILKIATQTWAVPSASAPAAAASRRRKPLWLRCAPPSVPRASQHHKSLS